MSSTGKTSQKRTHNRTKIQLEAALQLAEARLKEKTAELTKWKEKEEAIDSEAIPVSKSTFRIDLYDPGEGELQGKIEYPLMKAKKAFKGLDTDVIAAFIAKHLPEAAKVYSKRKLPSESPAALEPKAERHVLEFETLRSDRQESSQNLDHRQVFRVKLTFPPATSPEPENCNVLIYANPLGAGSRTMIGGTSKMTSGNASDVWVDIQAHALKPGMYQLEAAIQDKHAQKGGATSFDEIVERALIHVY